MFLVPCAIATGQLGAMFPGEGSIYLWTHKAFGPFWGFFAGFCAWWPGVLVMVATGTITEAFIGFAFPAASTWSVQVQGVVIVAAILFSALIAVLRFRVTQNVVNVVFILYGLCILALLGVEVPLNMGVEIRDQRSVTRYLLWGSLVVVVAYLLATWGSW